MTCVGCQSLTAGRKSTSRRTPVFGAVAPSALVLIQPLSLYTPGCNMTVWTAIGVVPVFAPFSRMLAPPECATVVSRANCGGACQLAMSVSNEAFCASSGPSPPPAGNAARPPATSGRLVASLGPHASGDGSDPASGAGGVLA